MTDAFQIEWAPGLLAKMGDDGMPTVIVPLLNHPALAHEWAKRDIETTVGYFACCKIDAALLVSVRANIIKCMTVWARTGQLRERDLEHYMRTLDIRQDPNSPSTLMIGAPLPDTKEERWPW